MLVPFVLPSRRRLLGFVAAGVALCVALPAAAAPKQAPRGLTASAVTDLSRIRREQSLPPLAGDPTLAALAQRYAESMARAGTMSHDVGGSFSSRIQAAGVRSGQAAENVAAGQRSWGEVLRDWMASSGHRSNILMRGATRVGAGRADGPGGPYWALVLAGPEPAATRPSRGEEPWPYGAFGGSRPPARP